MGYNTSEALAFLCSEVQLLSEPLHRHVARLRAVSGLVWRDRRSVRRFLFALIALVLLVILIVFAPSQIMVLSSTPVVEIALSDTPTPVAIPSPIETEPPAETAIPIETPVATATATITPTPTNTPTSSPIPFYPTLTPKPRPSITPTATPHVFRIEELNSEEVRMIQDGLALLKQCAPPMYDYVRSHVNVVTRGTATGLTAYVYTDVPIVYLPQTGTINDPRRYRDSLRTFVAAVVLVHEARHIELGRNTTEPDAYAFSLPLLEPCKPNDIGDENTEWDWRNGYDPYLLYRQFRQYQEWRATLPYPHEPPAGVTPPPVR